MLLESSLYFFINKFGFPLSPNLSFTEIISIGQGNSSLNNWEILAPKPPSF